MRKKQMMHWTYKKNKETRDHKTLVKEEEKLSLGLRPMEWKGLTGKEKELLHLHQN